jgi:anti-sigma factor RsiW
MTFPLEHCADCVELLGEYVEGTLPPEKAAALEAHLSTCPPCITFVRTYKATRLLCRHKLAREMPPELKHSLQTFLAKNVPGYSADEPSASAAAPGPSKKN